MIHRYLIWSCLLLPHETAGGKVGPFLPEEEKTEADGGEVGGAEIRLAPGAWRHPKLRSPRLGDSSGLTEKQGQDGVGALQKFQPLATRGARGSRGDGEGPQSPEAR